MMLKTEVSTANVRPHVQVLREQLLMRQRRNARFSLRAFAQLLELHPSALSRILSGKQEISVKSCLTIFEKLQIEEPVREEFIESVVNEKKDSLIGRLTSENCLR